jgi:hypothetical protein
MKYISINIQVYIKKARRSSPGHMFYCVTFKDPLKRQGTV